MQYIDAHVHFWDLTQQINSWVRASNINELQQNFLLADYLAKNVKPVGVVSVEAADGRHSLDEVKWLAAKIVNNPEKIQLRHLAYLDLLQEPESFQEKLAQFLAYPWVRGFRDIHSFAKNSNYCPRREDFSLNRQKLQNFARNLGSLAQYNYIFSAQMYPEQLLRVHDLILASKVYCIIDHCGLPLLENSQQRDEWCQMLRLYGQSGYYFKLSGIAMNDNFNQQRFIFEQMFKFIAADKLIFGSNFPLVPEGSCSELQKFLQSHGLTDFSQQVFYANAALLFDFKA